MPKSEYLTTFRKSDLPKLILCEKELLNKQKWIEEALKKIKSQKITLQVENLQLTSLLAAEIEKEKNALKSPTKHTPKETLDCQEPEAPTISVNQLDEVGSTLNTKELDLRVMNEMNGILNGVFSVSKVAEYSSEDEDL